jgi:Macrocin-O-methyltransferase (TylF)
MIKALIRKTLKRAGYVIVNDRRHYAADGLFTVHSDHFRRDPAFQSAYQRGLQAADGVDPDCEWRLHVALWAASCALGVPGDFVECGVNKGFVSSAIMQRLHWGNRSKRFYLVDTFAGPVTSQFSANEIERGRLKIAEAALASGAYETDIDRVKANFAEWPNAIVVPGAVPEILPQVKTSRVAFLHLDMNCAYPECTALQYFWEKLSSGAIVLLDDYTYHGYESQMEAMDELGRSLGFEVLSLPTGQGVIRKG